ncbi:unnamed protein product [Allacma fusca]|uniref:Transcription elongation factor spt6 n=1 Tax=Allacma fusca TaxID=39272 RepID=A0A8J2JMM3_9HEXA|nr:unnamed protein product [Allacma fusca]
MADFIDSEAEESENEEEDTPSIAKKPKRTKVIDSDEDEEEDDGEEVNDLIDDNPIEEDESDAESDSSRKRKKSDNEDDDDSDDRLEDEDYDLLEENLGVKVKRKQFKRLKRLDEDSGDEDTMDRGNEREAIATQLFEGSDNEEDRPPPPSESGGHGYASEESEGEYSETDDFIVDDDGRPITEKRKRRKPIFTDATLQEAQDIFGVDFDYDEFEKYDDEYYEDEEEEEDEYEDDEQRTKRVKKQPRKKRKQKSIYELYEPSELERAGFTAEDNSIRNQDIPERMQLRNVPITQAEEDEIKEEALWIYDMVFSKRKPAEQLMDASQDKPASAKSTSAGVNWDDWDTPTASEAPGKSAAEEDDWDAPAPPPPKADLSTQPSKKPFEEEDWDNASTVVSEAQAAATSPAKLLVVTEINSADEEHKQKFLPKIEKALDFIRNNFLEVPFIAFYRKEYVGPELNMNELWEIYRADGRYCQLRTRKNRLLQLFKNIRDYQHELIFQRADEPLSDSVRLVSDDDYDRIKGIKSSEELKDMYLQFTLYYSDDVIPMKTMMLKKKREKEKQQKESAKAAAAARANEENDEEGQREPAEVSEIPTNEEDDEQSMALKRKMGGGTYALCRKMGLDGFTKQFGLTPQKFAENVRDSYTRHEIDQIAQDPLTACKDYISPRLTSAEDVLKATKFMVATQLSREPVLRQSVREVFFHSATINVHPTKRGLKEIDENHPVYTMKFLRDKPVRDLMEDQFLKLTIAEEDKLIVMTVGEQIKAITSGASYVDEVKKLYILEEFSSHVQAWNEVRSECVEFALEKLLFPVLRKELRAKLLDESKEWILKLCSAKLFSWISVAPYKVSFSPEEDDEFEVSKGLRVLALAYVPDYTQASFACFISPDGEPSDYLRLQNITKHRKAFRESDRQEKEADLLAFKNFMRQKKPHVVVIGGESRDALMIQEDINGLVMELNTDENFPMINVEIVDNQLAKVYSNSLKANAEFREYPLILRQAISLGRLIQDPLVEYSQLCTPDEEILCLRYHKLQDHVPKEDLLERLQLEFVSRVNEVGVDVNRAIANPCTANLVQFVCGLGARKAAMLLKTLKQANQRLENRTQLITVCHMGPKIFINCSGFIKIDTNSLGDSTESYVEVLDGSRVHPETYEWARKMAVDALEYDDEDPNPAGALEEILEAPERLKDLDLDAFADELQRQGFGNKSITLYDIRAELNNRYKDLRIPYCKPNAEELFNMLTKETPETLYNGKLITCQVVNISHKKPQGEQLDNAVPVRNEETGMWQCAFCMKNDFPDLSEVWNHFDAGGCPGQAIGVRIRLDNGISGFIPITKLSDKPVTNPDQRVRRGQTIHCRVVKIDVEKFSVECTSRTSDLVDENHEYRPKKDDYYDHEAENKEKKKEEDARKSKLKQTYIKRVIVHPSFKNISFRESEKLMEQMDQGEVIVRPSSKGADHLTVTWKVCDGIYQHIDVREEGKENAFSLGQSLWIGKEEFEDLDEIIARHVNPMAGYCRDIMNYKYHTTAFGGVRQKAEEYLLEEKKKNANKIHYMLHATKEFPGRFYISYLPRNKVVHELITITPEGYRFRQQNFDSLNQVLKWFKEHYRDPPPTVTPAMVTPRVPTRTPYETPRHLDAMSRIGAPAPSQFGGTGSVVAHTTPHYTTPGQQQAYTPFSQFTSHNTPYTPTAQTPYMTPYQTPYGGQATPRLGLPNQPNAPASTVGGTTPGNDHRRPRPGPKSIHNGNRPNESDDWRRAAEHWAKASTKANIPPAPPSSRFGGGNPAPFGPPGNSRPPPKSPAARNAAQVIIDGINKTKQMNSSALNYIPHKSPRSGRESLRSTPRTNFSPRSMVESSLGDETPLYDEN